VSNTKWGRTRQPGGGNGGGTGATDVPEEDLMNAPAEPNNVREQIALFRYGIIADLLHRDEAERGLYAAIREKAARSYEIPGTRRTNVAAETIRHWLKLWRKGGFEALRPRARNDVGQPRAIAKNLADWLCQLKDENPELTVPLLIAAARKDEPAAKLAPSTVHRLLTRRGLMKKRAGEPTSKDRRRFAFEQAGQLWLSDVMHAVPVEVIDRRKHKTYLIALLDDATRVVPYAAFALSENVAAFLPVLEQAIRRRGLPERLYVDNGSAYRSNHLSLVCAKLGMTLIHSRPYVPQGRGKIERFFRTVRMQLMPVLTSDDLRSLDALNQRLWGWIEGEYHQRPHKGLDGETPLDRWARKSSNVRMPDPKTDFDGLFLFEERRRVQKDRTVSLRGVLYEVDAVLVGETVTLRFDPHKLGRPVEVWHDGKRVSVARRVDAYANCFVKRDHATKAVVPSDKPASPAQPLRMADLPVDDGTEVS
jgi:putative transposase